MSSADRGRVLLISENQAIPGDRRVWAEARTLAAAGWSVTVICPHAQDEDQLAVEVRDGIAIHRYPLRPAAGTLGYVREYLQALIRIRALARDVERDGRFDVVHLANPPDFLNLAVARLRSRGAKVIFDHHDLVPELFVERFGRRGPLHRMLLAMERHTLRTADVVISTNDSYRRIAIERGGVPAGSVFVVRNGPDLERFTPLPSEPALLRGRRHLIAYLGVMGPQDGIDRAVDALAELRRLRGDDWHAAFIGDGEVVPAMRDRAARLGIGEQVEFTGWRRDEDIRRWLSTADVCLAPDPPGPLNDVSTMAKIPEYMAMGRAIASFDLPETRVSAADAAAYAASDEAAALGACVDALLDDPERRRTMGEAGRRRVRDLSWAQSEAILLEAYEHATRRATVPAPVSSGRVAIGGSADGPGHGFR